MRRVLGWSLPTLTIVIVIVAAALWGHQRVREFVDARVAGELMTTLSTTHQAVRSWVAASRKTAAAFANTPQIDAGARALLGLVSSGDALRRAPAQAALRNWLEPALTGGDYLGYVLIDRGGITLASSHDANIGRRNLLADQNGFLERIWRGEALVSLPLNAAVPLPDRTGTLSVGVPTMFAAAPVPGDDGRTIAILAFRIDPFREFAPIFRRGDLVNTGETYAFDSTGLMISTSRHLAQLEASGQRTQPHQGMLETRLRDPGAGTLSARLTRMAKAATAGRSGRDLAGYRDYRGTEVVGAWLWDRELNFGIATEIDVAEAFAGKHLGQRLLFVGTAMVIAVILAGVILAFWAQSRVWASGKRFRDFADTASDWLWEIDDQFRYTYLSAMDRHNRRKEVESALGARKHDIYADSAQSDDPVERERWRQHLSDLEQHKPFRIFMQRWTSPSGEVHHFLSSGTPIFNANGRFLGYRGSSSDITGLVRAEAALRQSEARYQAILENMVDTYYRTDLDGRVVMASPSARNLLGYEVDELIGRRLADFYLDPDGRTRFLAALQDNGGRVVGFEAALRRKDGEAVWVSTNARHVRDDADNVIGIEGTSRDVTAAKRADQELRRSESLLKEAHRIAGLGNWVSDRSGNLQWSDGIFQMFGIGREDFDGTTASFYSRVHPDDRERVWSVTQRAWQERRPYELVHRIVRPDGEIRHIRERGEVICDDAGGPPHLNGTVHDITDMVLAEERLRQTLKMEAVGQLTGGIAHDFNNLLAVILGNSELLAEQAESENPQLRAIVRAAVRGADLTQRLLAFASRQPLRPRPIDLGRLVGETSDLLLRTLGEGIAIETEIAPDAGPASADPSQLEDLLIALVINARDAMPDGGRVTIACANVRLDEDFAARHPEADLRPGAYVALSVSDSGVGMSDEVARRAFEPFFTTKPGGEASGLGLSTVYGFARQSGGFATIESGAGEGTTVTVYLPRADTEPAGEHDHAPEHAPKGDGQRVLLIEDDPDVRQLAVRMLHSLDYAVVDVAGRREAMSTLDSERFDLVLSDVVLGGGDVGPEIVRDVRERIPTLKVVFMSGYPAHAAQGSASLVGEDNLLRKPFQLWELAQAMRNALDADAA